MTTDRPALVARTLAPASPLKPAEPAVARPARRGATAILLSLATLTSMLNILDRSALNILAEPIKLDLHLSDTQLGLLTGFAFALFYSVIGLPIARHVDRPRTNRPKVIALCIACWSLMTVISGLALSYGQLLAARVLVGVGESGSGPAFFTLISDQVPRTRRVRAFGIYGLGAPLGMLLGLLIGGVLVERVGWRMTFVILGLPGLLLALCMAHLLHEPRSRASGLSADRTADLPGFVQTLQFFGRSPALICLCVAAATGATVLLGQPSWAAVYLIRVLKLKPSQVGLLLGLSLGLGGLVGSYLGGLWGERVGRTDPGRALLVAGVGLLIGIPASIFAYSSSSWMGFAATFWVTVLGASFYMGPMVAVLQIAVPENLRATASVIVFMLANLVGGGLAPLLIGMGSDLLRASQGLDSLRLMLVISAAAAVVPSIFYVLAARLMGRQIAQVDGKMALDA